MVGLSRNSEADFDHFLAFFRNLFRFWSNITSHYSYLFQIVFLWGGSPTETQTRVTIIDVAFSRAFLIIKQAFMTFIAHLTSDCRKNYRKHHWMWIAYFYKHRWALFFSIMLWQRVAQALLLRGFPNSNIFLRVFNVSIVRMIFAKKILAASEFSKCMEQKAIWLFGSSFFHAHQSFGEYNG